MNTDRTPHDETSVPDLALLGDLRAAIEHAEPIPPDAIALAKAAFDWRSLDAELAQLVHDSAVDDAALLVRGDDDHRVLSFATPNVRIDVEYADRQLVGLVTPAESAIVDVFRGDDSPVATATTDEFGAFVIPDVDAGRCSLRCRAADGAWSVRTEWTAL